MDRPEEALYRYFQRIFPDTKEYDSYYRPVLSCLAGAQEPVPLDFLRQFCSLTTVRFQAILRKLEGLVAESENSFGQAALTIASPALAAWLQSAKAGPYWVKPEMSGKKIAEYLVSVLKADPSELSEFEAYYLPYYVKTYAPRLAPLGLNVLLSSYHYLWRLLNAGDAALKGKNTELAGSYYRMALTYAAGWVNRVNTHYSRRACIAALHRMGGIYESRDGWDTAIALYEKSLELSRESLKGHVSVDNLQAVRISAKKAGDASRKSNRNEQALAFYEEAIEASYRLASVSDQYDKKLGDLCFTTGMFVLTVMKDKKKARPFLKRAAEVYGRQEALGGLKAAVEKILQNLPE